MKTTLEVRQPIHAVYYRNTAFSARIASFLDPLAGGHGAYAVRGVAANRCLS